MKQKHLIIGVAAMFSIVFSIVYYCLFSLLQEQTDEVTLYMVQIGLYEKQESVESMQEKLASDGFTSYTLKSGDKTAVVIGVSESEEANTSLLTLLEEKSYSYVEKSVTIQDQELIALVKEQSYQEVLERIET